MHNGAIWTDIQEQGSRTDQMGQSVFLLAKISLDVFIESTFIDEEREKKKEKKFPLADLND